MIIIKTTLGNIIVELYPDSAPVTVSNFLNCVGRGFYNGTIFHRVIDGFMIQGGGFTVDVKQKPTNPPIFSARPRTDLRLCGARLLWRGHHRFIARER